MHTLIVYMKYVRKYVSNNTIQIETQTVSVFTLRKRTDQNPHSVTDVLFVLLAISASVR
uniref:Transposase n=1 Tax=Ascaris lumbricoides TaxID=6252 RepID=A0A0M3HFR1_ASCLU